MMKEQRFFEKLGEIDANIAMHAYQAQESGLGQNQLQYNIYADNLVGGQLAAMANPWEALRALAKLPLPKFDMATVAAELDKQFDDGQNKLQAAIDDLRVAIAGTAAYDEPKATRFMAQWFTHQAEERAEAARLSYPGAWPPPRWKAPGE